MGHFSPRALAAAMSRTVTRRGARPPYSGSGIVARDGVVRAVVAATPESPAGAVMVGTSLPRGARAASPDTSIMPRARPGLTCPPGGIFSDTDPFRIVSNGPRRPGQCPGTPQTSQVKAYGFADHSAAPVGDPQRPD